MKQFGYNISILKIIIKTDYDYWLYDSDNANFNDIFIQTTHSDKNKQQ